MCIIEREGEREREREEREREREGGREGGREERRECVCTPSIPWTWLSIPSRTFLANTLSFSLAVSLSSRNHWSEKASLWK